MQHSIAEISTGIFQLSEKTRHGEWQHAYFVKQAWGHCLVYNLLQIEPFIDFFKTQGGIAFHLLSEAAQFSATNARIFFKFGATTLVPPGPHALGENEVARVLTYGSQEYFKANLQYLVYDAHSPRAILALTASGKQYLFADSAFIGNKGRMVFQGGNLPAATSALRSLLLKLKTCDYVLLSHSDTPSAAVLAGAKDPIDILNLLAPNNS